MDTYGDKILRAIPYDFPVTERPYEVIAREAGITEDDLIRGLGELKRKGFIRRIGAVLSHRRVAYTHNAMVVWKVDEGEEERIGNLMASFPEVSHCYEREKGGYWDYTIFTMIHGKTMGDCMDVVERISKETGITMFKVFFSRREFKKTSFVIGTNE